ncbi:hypothetical protein R3I93_019697 [Phoxinus phoxinus]|uniref:Uncharacterized protein n=1 Tax=Phoxinus phoxinus TaxID=58324 RepID=A0AAN9GVM4_9TELE
MNSMFSVWTLSSLILSYTLAFPIFNNTSRGSDMETFPNVTEIMENNKTRLMENMETFPNISTESTTVISNFTEVMGNRSDDHFPMGFNCRLSTCTVHNLPVRLQTGDEKAGELTQDPWGPGKK